MYIAENSFIGENVSIGKNVVIEDNVKIGNNCKIGHNVVVHRDTIIGDNVTIGDNTVLGKEPYVSAMSATTKKKDLKPLIIKSNVVIGANCIIYRGSEIDEFVFIGDLASIREDVKIGLKTVIGKGVTVENRTTIGKKVKIETNAYITAISIIEDYCFIAPEVTFTNDNFLGRTEERKKYFKGPTLKKGARIGANATILPGIIIGEDAVVGAGSVVTKDLEPRKIYVGVPAKYFKDVPEEQLIEKQVFYDG